MNENNVVNIDVSSLPGPDAVMKVFASNGRGESIGYNAYHMVRNGKPWLPSMGEFQYSRCPHEEWEAELLKIKAGGVDILATYVFWIHHEQEQGQFDWSGDLNLKRFIEIAARCGFYVALRIGPFCHGEARNGGLPDWLYGMPFEVRSNAPEYLALVKRLYQEIGQQVRGFMYAQGGPIISVQCENEFMDSAAPWETTHNIAMEYTPKGRDGREHMLELKRLACEAGLEVPIFTATGWGQAPILPEEFLPLFGGYAFYSWIDASTLQDPTHNYIFRVAHGREHRAFDTTQVPYACCELGGGIQVFYGNRPVVPAASVEAMHVTYLGSGANLMGYYVYHGGSNPVGKHSFLNEHRCPRISYDFQAPIGEFGQVRESYHRLRRQFLFLQRWGSNLASMRTLIAADCQGIQPTDTSKLRWAMRAANGEGFVFLNNYQDHVSMPDRHGQTIHIQSQDRVLRIPVEGTFSLRADACAIWPVNFTMGAVKLCYATLQPLTCLRELDGSLHYYFWALNGTNPEYLFDAAAVRNISGGSVDALSQGLRVRVIPGLESTIRIEAADQTVIHVTTLTEAQSLAAWVGTFAGRERLVLCDAELRWDKDRIDIVGNDSQPMSLWVSPAPESAGVIQSRGQAVAPQLEGCFARYDLKIPALEISFDIHEHSSVCWVVRVGFDGADELEDVLLKVECVGDVAAAYQAGQLVHDHFCNGTPWEIGTRRLMGPSQHAELVLRVVPSQKGQQVQFTAMAAIQAVQGPDDPASKARIIKVEPMKRVKVTIQT